MTTPERRRATDSEVAEIRRDVGDLKMGFARMESAFSGSKDLTETLMQAMVDDHKEFKREQKKTNEIFVRKIDSLEGSRDRLWGWFWGAVGTGGSLGAVLSRIFMGHF